MGHGVSLKFSISVDAGFLFQLFGRGGNGPPPSEGGLWPIGGGMTRDAFATLDKLIF
jgi:hypothetical protein